METEIITKADLNPKELVLMSNLYLAKDYPFNFMTLEEVADLLQISKATAITVTSKLTKKGMITKERGFITFYYPVNNRSIRRLILNKLGLFK